MPPYIKSLSGVERTAACAPLFKSLLIRESNTNGSTKCSMMLDATMIAGDSTLRESRRYSGGVVPCSYSCSFPPAPNSMAINSIRS